MHYNLTDNIYWGDRFAISELKDVVKAVVCVAHNQRMVDEGYTPLVLPYTTPYLKMADKDRSFPPKEYFDTLYSVFKTFKGRYSPILVHCCKGIHRSPITALLAALAVTDTPPKKLGEYYSKLFHVIWGTSPDHARALGYNYSQSAQLWMGELLP